MHGQTSELHMPKYVMIAPIKTEQRKAIIIALGVLPAIIIPVTVYAELRNHMPLVGLILILKIPQATGRLVQAQIAH